MPKQDASTDTNINAVHNMLGFTLIIGASMGISYLYNGHVDGRDAGHFFGSYFILAAFGAWALQTIQALKQSLGFMLSMGIIMVIAAGFEAAGNGFAFEGRMTHTEARNLKYALQDVMLEAMTGEPSQETHYDRLPSGYQQLLELIGQQNQSLISAQRNYEHLVQNEDLVNMLDPSTLSQASGPPPQALAHAFDGLKQFRQTADDYYLNLSTRINELNIDQKIRNSFIKGWESNRETKYRILNDLIENQQNALTTVLKIYKLCANNPTGYDPSDGRMVFESAATLQQFNRLIEELNRLAAEEEVLMKRQTDMQTEVLQNMREAFKDL